MTAATLDPVEVTVEDILRREHDLTGDPREFAVIRVRLTSDGRVRRTVVGYHDDPDHTIQAAISLTLTAADPGSESFTAVIGSYAARIDPPRRAPQP